MEDKSDKKVEDAQLLGPALTLSDQNVYLGLQGDAKGCRNPRRVTDYFKSVSRNPPDVNTAAVDTNAKTKSDATFYDNGSYDEFKFMISTKGEDSPIGAVGNDIELGFDEVDEQKKPPPTIRRAKSPTVDDVVVFRSDEEEATDNDSTDNDEDYDSDEDKVPPSTKRKANAKLEGKYRQGAISNKRSRKPPPEAAAAGNKHGSAPSTPIIYIGSYKAVSREYKEYLHFLAINRKSSPWSDCYYGCLRKRFSGHDFVLITNGQETKAKKADIIKSAAQMYKTILKKVSHAKEQVTNKRADRNDNNPAVAIRQRTAPVPVPALAQVADATPMNEGTDDIGNVLNTFLSVLRTRKEAAFHSEDDDVCAQGLKIKKFITHVEKGRATLSL
jgi:hypothetical protein